jgi:type II secretory pathway pseudopilin PulG
MKSEHQILRSRKPAGGFSIIELLVIISILAVLATFALIGIARARSSTQFSNTARVLQAYIERAVSDSKRRHALGSERARVEVLDNTSYKVTTDFNEDGLLETRIIRLPGAITFLFTAGSPPIATIDRHGNVAEGNVIFTLRSESGTVSEIKLSSIGDSVIDEQLPSLPTVTETPTSDDVKSSVWLKGDNQPNLDPSPTPAPTPLPFCTTNQKPSVDLCRCQPGRTIDDKGKCK